jgi:hypothetical protein
MPDIGSIGLSFSVGLGPLARGRWHSLFALVGSAAARLGNGARASAIIKRRQPFTSFRKGKDELEMKTKETTLKSRRTDSADGARGLL